MGLRERLSFESAERHASFDSASSHRYRFAAERLAGKALLELACGIGHGTMVLAAQCGPVRAVDSDVGAVDAAQAAREPIAHVTFAATDLAGAVRDSATTGAEAIVLVSDQVSEADGVLAALAEVARDGVPLVLAAAAAGTEKGGVHGRALRADALRHALEHVEDVAFFRQHLAEGSLILDEAARGDLPTSEGDAPGIDNVERGAASHVLAGVNLGLTLPGGRQVAPAWYVDPVDASYLARVEGANAALRRANSRLAREHMGAGQAPAARDLIRAVGERVEELEGELSVAEARRDEADAGLEELRGQSQELSTWAHELERQLLEVQASRVVRLGRGYWRLKQRLRRAGRA